MYMMVLMPSLHPPHRLGSRDSSLVITKKFVDFCVLGFIWFV
jgi:hypothetical protein